MKLAGKNYLIALLGAVLALPFSVARADMEFPQMPTDSLGPTIQKVEWADPARAGWAFAGVAGKDSISVKVTTDTVDDANYTVKVFFGGLDSADPSTMAGDPTQMFSRPGTETATRTDSGVFVATHTITNTARLGNLIYVQATKDGHSNYNATLVGFININIKDKGGAGAAMCGTTGDESTDLTQVADFRSVNLVMHCPGKGKIVFENPMDFSAYETMEALRTLGTKLDAEVGSSGKFGLSDETIAYIRNAGASVTIYGLPYLSAPDIKLNGGDSSSAVSSVSYDEAAKAVTFKAAHFSSYTAVPKVTITEPAVTTTSTTERRVTVRGTVNDPAATVRLYIGTTDQGTITVGSDGSFSKEVVLATGENTIKTNATNSIGTSFDVTRTLRSTALAATGSSSWLLWLVLGMFGLGGFLATRRMR